MELLSAFALIVFLFYVMKKLNMRLSSGPMTPDEYMKERLDFSHKEALKRYEWNKIHNPHIGKVITEERKTKEVK